MSENGSSPKNRLSRWSQRKLASRDAENRPDATPEMLDTEHIPDLAQEKEKQQNRDVAEAVDLQNLDKDSDFSLFMKDGVPDALRRKAYRLLWKTDPILANIDGLNDYDDDFADTTLIMKSFQSAWDINKGYKQEPVVLPDEVSSTEAEAEPSAPENTSGNEAVANTEDLKAADTEKEEGVSMATDDPSSPEQITQEASLKMMPVKEAKLSLRHRLQLKGPTSD